MRALSRFLDEADGRLGKSNVQFILEQFLSCVATENDEVKRILSFPVIVYHEMLREAELT